MLAAAGCVCLAALTFTACGKKPEETTAAETSAAETAEGGEAAEAAPVKPESYGTVTLGEYKNLYLEVRSTDISDERVDDYINNLVNGSPVQSLDAGAFRRQIGIVFQDSLLVTGTIRDNITLRDPAFTEKNIEDALSLSGMDKVVERLPNGLDTRVGLDGQSLSGGEMQRLAIARALVNRPRILFADEPTGNLDSKTTDEILRMFRRLNDEEGITIVLVTHDAEVCDYAKTTIHIKDGQVVSGMFK